MNFSRPELKQRLFSPRILIYVVLLLIAAWWINRLDKSGQNATIPQTPSSAEILSAGEDSHLPLVVVISLPDEAVRAVQECAEEKGVRAIIFRSPCVAITKPQGKCAVDTAKCVNCKKCIREIGCPALITEDGRVTIDRNLCTGCGLCSYICPVHAIGCEGE